MDDFAANLIEAMGGTTAVHRKSGAPMSTVQSWKKNGIPGSRLEHLRLIAEREDIAIDWETGQAIEAEADHVAPDTALADATSPGKRGGISPMEAANA